MSTDLSIHSQYYDEMRLRSPQYMPTNSNSVTLEFSSREYNDRYETGYFPVKSSVTIYSLDSTTAEGLHLFANMTADERRRTLSAMRDVVAQKPEEVAETRRSGGRRMTAYCETCRQTVESVNEADQCEECHDAWVRKLDAAYRDLYEGERRAGLHGEFTDEGLAMRLREMRGHT